MSFLWSRNVTINPSQNKKKIRKPSPTYIRLYERYSLSRSNALFFSASIKRISLFTSLREKNHCGLQASMTVEAAVILPVFLIFFLHLTSVIEMLRLHGNISFALWEAGKNLTLYAAAEEELTSQIPDIAISYLYVQTEMNRLLGTDYLDASPLAYGSSGVNYLSSDYLEDECIDIGVTYQVRPGVTIFPFPYLRLVNRFYGRAWTGFDVTAHQGDEQYRYVYVTEYGEVWHTTPNCSFLKVQIQEVALSRVGEYRNAGGSRYRPCERCSNVEAGEIVYLTSEGDCYHTISNCSALLRRIQAVLWREDLPYRPCSRCAVQ